MSLLKILKEGTSLFNIPSVDNLPPAIREKVFFIASLIDDATLFSAADRNYPEKISFKSTIKETPDRSGDTSCVVCGERYREVEQDDIMELAEIIDEIFRPLYPQESDRFDDTISKGKERQRVIIEIIQELESEQTGLGQRILNRINKDWFQSYTEQQSQDVYIENIKLMLQLEYVPGIEINDLVEKLNHLLQYWVLWPASKIQIGIALGNEALKGVEAYIAELKGRIAEEKNQTLDLVKANEALEAIKLSEAQDCHIDIKAVKAAEPVLDLSLAKIAYHLGMKIEHICYYGRRERNRGVNLGLAKQARNAPPISKAFWSLKFSKEVFPKGVSLNKVASMIQEVLRKENRPDPPPDIATISNYLKADEGIFKLFKPKLVGKKKFFIMEV
jgi:hypothetical protein